MNDYILGIGLLPHLLQPQVATQALNEAAPDDLAVHRLLDPVAGDGVAVQGKAHDVRGAGEEQEDVAGIDQERVLSWKEAGG